jgi:hypothetical protein
MQVWGLCKPRSQLRSFLYFIGAVIGVTLQRQGCGGPGLIRQPSVHKKIPPACDLCNFLDGFITLVPDSDAIRDMCEAG